MLRSVYSVSSFRRGHGLIKRLGITAHQGCLRRRPTRADVVGSDVDGAIEHGITGDAADDVDAAIVAQIHHLGAAIVTVTA